MLMDRHKDEKKDCLPPGGRQSRSVKKNIIKTVCLTIIKIFFWGAALLFLGAAVLLLLYFFDEEGSCMDLDGVWDHDQKICRYDCLAWTKETGCIPHDDPDPGSKIFIQQVE